MARILVIDDSQQVRDLVLAMLRLKGHDAIAAEDGLTGLKLARELTPDLIICDITMPKMDGYQLLQALRAEPETMIVPFIFLTAKLDKADRRRGMLLGADDYITKPFSVDELMQAVEVRLSRHAAVSAVFQREMAEVRRDMTETVPRELRTPLTGILTTSKVVLELQKTLQPEKVIEMVGVMHSAAARLYHLVENYVLYSELAIVVGHAELVEALREQCTADAGEVVAGMAVLCAEQAERASDLVLDTSCDGVRMEEAHLRKIVLELVDNAFKFSPRGIPVAVTARSEGDSFVLAVTDCGRGMGPEQIAAVCTPTGFDREKTEPLDDDGLGLAIVRELAHLYGGKMEIKSTPGIQTTVRVTLPAA